MSISREDQERLELFDRPIDQDHESDDSSFESEDAYDSEGYGDEEDRQNLAKMAPAERLLLLGERLQQRETRQRRLAKYRELKQRNKAEKKPAARSQKSTAKRPLGGSTAALADLKKRRGKRVSRDADDDYLSSSEEDDAFQDDDDDEYRLSDDGQPSSKRSRRAGRHQQQEEEPERHEPATKEELESVVLKRDTIAKWVNEPYFEDLIGGFFVRLCCFSGLGDNKSKYIVAKVRNFKRNPAKPYQLPGARQAEPLTVYLELSDYKGRHTYQGITQISNSPITQAEFDEFRAAGETAPFPTQHHVAQKRRDLVRVSEWAYTEEQIAQMIRDTPEERRNRLKLKIRDMRCAIRLLEAQQQRRALSSGDTDEQLERDLASERARLADAEREMRGLGEETVVRAKLESSLILSRVEQRKQAAILTHEQRAMKERSSQDAAARRDTAPKPLWSVQQSADANNAAQPNASNSGNNASSNTAPLQKGISVGLQRVPLSASLSKSNLASKIQSIHPGPRKTQPNPSRVIIPNPHLGKPGFEYSRIPNLADSGFTLSEYISAKDQQITPKR